MYIEVVWAAHHCGFDARRTLMLGGPTLPASIDFYYRMYSFRFKTKVLCFKQKLTMYYPVLIHIDGGICSFN